MPPTPEAQRNHGGSPARWTRFSDYDTRTGLDIRPVSRSPSQCSTQSHDADGTRKETHVYAHVAHHRRLKRLRP